MHEEPHCLPATSAPTTSARRFGGVARLYGDSALASFQAARVCVIGVGGVGSWAVEALARSGIGGLSLVDADHVAESNINRQLPALEQHLGRAKIEVLAERIAGINPGCSVSLVDAMISLDNLAEHLHPGFNAIIDCSDNARVKAGIANFCRRNHVPLVVTGGAGGKLDPTRIRVNDLTRVSQDPLLARMRRHLRGDYGYSRNPRRSYGLPCVWSDEAPLLPSNATGLNCAGAMGSVVTVTAAFGMAAAARALQQLAGPRPGSARPLPS